ncbi:nuclease [Dermacoccus sp. PE3]|uniref:lamin tail domain-containing protein n=1 Tax=Dermacoccus sp. PE3 TaxID=1641401 RepID=UPI0006425C16|nr:lamin tail domain-containing protein [Dermacoccus sp. PE3]KLO63475.1 nuclease [Dermacoccus sp. PE3]
MGQHPPRRFLAGTAALVVVGALGTAFSPAQAASSTVLVSEVFGGGGNSGAPLRSDFVELYNASGTAIDLTGWSVQYWSASGTSAQTTPLTGSVPAGHHFLVQEADGANTSAAALPNADVTGRIPMSSSAGRVALVNADGATVDLVGWGNAAVAEGAPAPATSNTTSVARRSECTDTDDNASDFATGAPSPAGAAAGASLCSAVQPPAPSATTIQEIQGSSHLSPLRDQRVSGVAGVITATSRTGFWMQAPSDENDATSDAVFVYTRSAPAQSVGDAVEVAGVVTEFRPGGASGNDNLTTTQISSPKVSVTGHGQAIPAVWIGKDRIAPQQTIEAGDPKSVEYDSAVFDPARHSIDFNESLEGMKVALDDARAVGPTNARYGETPVVPGQNVSATTSPRGGVVYGGYDRPNAMRLVLDDSLIPANSIPAANVGDTYTGTTMGIMDYAFAMPHVLVTTPAGHMPSGLTRETTSAQSNNQLAVATFNVENLAPSDQQDKYDRLADQVTTNLRSPDVLALEEIQDNNGVQNDGTVDSSTTVRKLVDTIKARGGPAYEARWVNPEDGQDGGAPGGNIRQVFLFRTDRDIDFVDAGNPSATTATQVIGRGKKAALTVSPGRIDPTNPAFADSRKPLVGQFRFRGENVFVIANHFNSKGGDDPLFGRWQQPVRSSETQRHAQAQVVRTFTDQLLAADPDARIVALGDINDFEFSRTTDILVGSGANAMTDLPRTLPANERYSYVYEGNSQTLDHILVSPQLTRSPKGWKGAPYSYDIVHTNSEFTDQDSDHDPQVVRLQIRPN